MEPGLFVETNRPLDIVEAYAVLLDNTAFPPLVWIEERGWRDVKPGHVAPPGVVPSRWIEEREFLLYVDNEDIRREYGKTWVLLLRKPTDEEYNAIQWG